MENIDINRRYNGYQQTPILWEGSLEDLRMFVPGEHPPATEAELPDTLPTRLGKLMEHFVLGDLQADKNNQILSSNVQIFRGQTTIGELDCLLNQSGVNLHLEIVFKFYLYDPAISGELDRWIGPNRNDTLVFKLNKLKEKQLPLLHAPETAPLLEALDLNPAEIDQQVCFKAQLFVPFRMQDATYPLVNPACIKGFYLRPEELGQFHDHSFFIPTKLDWPVEPHSVVGWISFQAFYRQLDERLTQKRSPLCWMKSPEGEMKKFFVVWWE